jgi:hypothetical protein
MSRIGNLLNIICIVHHSFCHKKARCKFKIIAWSAHGNGNRFSPARVGWTKAQLYLERFFRRQVILHLPRIEPGNLHDRCFYDGAACPTHGDVMAADDTGIDDVVHMQSAQSLFRLVRRPAWLTRYLKSIFAIMPLSSWLNK